MNAASSASSLSGGWRNGRRKRLALAVGMLVFLLLAAGGLLLAVREAREARLETVLAQRAHRDALQIQAQTQSRAELEKTARQLSRLAEARRATPRYWAKRFIDLRQTQLARADANTLFQSFSRTNGRLFHIEAFDLSVTENDKGLFHPSGNALLLLTVRGTLLFRAGGGEP
ncbi:MAG: hypothetical protein LBU11_01940 [Zoogloeaceae bacterium]|jgi:hypothetical protein|nr:hypothetical protein [Zoogloeaceae bacterium]